MIYDLIIVGMGPAGVSAAIYAARAGLNILCFESKMIGGYLNYIDRIDNYPGLYGISGPDFAFKLFETIKELKIECRNKTVDKVIDCGDYKTLIVGDEEYKCKNVIISVGRKMRSLGVPKEDELLGKGISRCALCDGNFYKGKDVAVVGGGNSALQEALYLANICNKVYLIHRRDSFRGSNDLIEKVSNKDNIDIIYNCNVKELITSNDTLSGIKLDDGTGINVSGLFIYIGFKPDTEFVSCVDVTDSEGYLEVDEKCETRVKGIYGAGDIIRKDIYQIATAVNDGVVAVTNIIESVNKNR